MSDLGISVAKVDMPLTDFVVALYKMTMAQRMAASPQRAAERYGLGLELCDWWIGEARKSEDQWPIRRSGK